METIITGNVIKVKARLHAEQNDCLEISTRQTILFDLTMFFNKARCSHGAARTSMTYGRV